MCLSGDFLSQLGKLFFGPKRINLELFIDFLKNVTEHDTSNYRDYYEHNESQPKPVFHFISLVFSIFPTSANNSL